MIMLISGVTPEGGGNWRCHPIFLEKKSDAFLVITAESVMTMF